MALKRLGIKGYGQVELNNCAFRRDGRIEAQCELDAVDFASVPAENGMVLAVDKANGVIKFYDSGEKLPVALVYTSEHMYDERANALSNFKNERGKLLPRLGYLAAGDSFTTNTLAYDTTEYSSEQLCLTALKNCASSAVYATACDNGAWKVTATAPTSGIVAKIVKAYTMPDGQFGAKIHVISC